MPVPFNVTICGLLAALSVSVRLAVREPAAVGEKVMLIVHEALTASVPGLMGQVLVCEKSPAFVPATVTALMVRAALPLLVSVTVCAAEVEPVFWPPKFTTVGFRLTAGALV